MTLRIALSLQNDAVSDVMFPPKVKLKRTRVKLQQAIQERLSKVEKVKLEHPKESQVQSKDLIRQLEEEISELQRRSSELEQLSQTEDDLHFIQVCRKLDRFSIQ